jgi:hypothetical protein
MLEEASAAGPVSRPRSDVAASLTDIPGLLSRFAGNVTVGTGDRWLEDPIDLGRKPR